jgi:hypothetical protein
MLGMIGSPGMIGSGGFGWHICEIGMGDKIVAISPECCHFAVVQLWCGPEKFTTAAPEPVRRYGASA